ncbi:hypothetical protein C8R44DRAFT_754344 [Mycena epipterygia]|nr:hypothetical protein C8R44DRAFT_754344 [Mycena epipterygia]
MTNAINIPGIRKMPLNGYNLSATRTTLHPEPPSSLFALASFLLFYSLPSTARPHSCPPVLAISAISPCSFRLEKPQRYPRGRTTTMMNGRPGRLNLPLVSPSLPFHQKSDLTPVVDSLVQNLAASVVVIWKISVEDIPDHRLLGQGARAGPAPYLILRQLLYLPRLDLARDFDAALKHYAHGDSWTIHSRNPSELCAASREPSAILRGTRWFKDAAWTPVIGQSSGQGVRVDSVPGLILRQLDSTSSGWSSGVGEIVWRCFLLLASFIS